MVVPHNLVYPRRMRSRPGYTVIELSLVMLLATMLFAAAAPGLAHGRNVIAVRAARAEVVAAAAAARSAAVMNGGASLLIDTRTATAWIETHDGERIGLNRPLGSNYGVTIESTRAEPVRIRYDALGVGRLANASIRVRRGSVVAAITVSAYGRVR